jgi:hypothetical protein
MKPEILVKIREDVWELQTEGGVTDASLESLRKEDQFNLMNTFK